MNTIFIPRNIEERKIKFRKENLRLLQQEILTVNTDNGWLYLDETWRDINPKYVKCKQINGDVYLNFNEDGCIPDWLENITINGNFNCFNNKLNTLKGCPKIIKKSFNCSYNQLTSLEDGPIEVDGHYWCYNNKTIFTKEYVKSICNVKNKIYI